MYREEHTVNWTRPEFIRPDVSSCLLQPFNAPSVTPCNSSGPSYWKNKLTRAGYKRLDELKDPALYPDVHVDEALVTRYLEEKGIKEEVETLRSALKAHEEARKLIEITAEAIQQKLEDPCTLLISSHFSVENNVEQRLRTLVARHFNEELKEKAQPEIERIEQALEALDDQLHLPRTPADERAFIEAMARLFHAEIKG